MANPSATQTLADLQKATLDDTVIRQSGSGKAFQSVSQSAAIAVQDATDFVRNISTISSTALGIAMSNMIEDPTKASDYSTVITNINNIMSNAATFYKDLSGDSATVVNKFPTN